MSHTKGMKGLMENSSHLKALWRSQVDILPVAFVHPPNLGVAEGRWVLSVPLVCEDQVGALVALVHLSKKKCIFSWHISVHYKDDETHLKLMQGTPVSIFRRAWVMLSI